MAPTTVPMFLKALRDLGYEAAKKTVGGGTGSRCGVFLATLTDAELEEWQSIIYHALPDNHTSFSVVRDMFDTLFDIQKYEHMQLPTQHAKLPKPHRRDGDDN